MATLPTIFVSHGAPTLVIEPLPTHDFFIELGKTLPRPEAILCVSAHWEAAEPMLSGTAQPETSYDFSGFPDELYQMHYPAPGSPALAKRVAIMLMQAGFSAMTHPERGLDHGAWVPLKLMYPQADIPVVQLSVQSRQGAAHHLALGKALQPLRQEGVLILASGGATHNLLAFRGQPADSPVQEYAAAFDVWLDTCIAEGRDDLLVDYLNQGPSARRNHPTPEHYLPLLVAAGAAGAGAQGKRIHHTFAYGILSMAAFAWD
jgi:4,5-DOPA dioxygenase extradiol